MFQVFVAGSIGCAEQGLDCSASTYCIITSSCMAVQDVGSGQNIALLDSCTCMFNSLHQFLILCSLKAVMFVKLYFRTSDIHLISLGSIRRSFANEIDGMHSNRTNIRRLLHIKPSSISVLLDRPFLGMSQWCSWQRRCLV